MDGKRKKGWILIFAIMLQLHLLSGCAAVRRQEREVRPDVGRVRFEKPRMPKALGAKEGEEPRLSVYIKEEGKVKDMAFEEYVAGVVGGEIKNNWPQETIKAQAIIARTFVLRFIEEKGGSKYKGAHVSTDIEEAQAWNMEAVNDNIRRAVKATRGDVIVYEGGLAYTWFHSNAGGKTANAVEGLNFKEGNPPYIRSVKSPDGYDYTEIPADDRKWTAKFSKSEVLAALNKIGSPIKNFSNVTVGKRGDSGRAMTIRFDQTDANAPDLRIALDSMKMKSTLLDNVGFDGKWVSFEGRGYGHGVGMAQWGAHRMAKQGKKAKDIISHYYKGVQITNMWK
jgi:stage II sporulation protein D